MTQLPPPPRIIGTGEVADLFRAWDWRSTPLGPMENWSEVLLSTVNLLLAAPFPAALYWGSELVLLYNDAYRAMLSDKHLRSLGQAGREVWLETWPLIAEDLGACLTQ